MPRVRLVDCHMLARMISRDQLSRLSIIYGVRALEEDSPGQKKDIALITVVFRLLSSASNSASQSGDSKKKSMDDGRSILSQETYSPAFW
jgi:hypothetical protein